MAASSVISCAHDDSGMAGLSHNSGTNCTDHLSAHKGNLLCLWSNR